MNKSTIISLTSDDITRESKNKDIRLISIKDFTSFDKKEFAEADYVIFTNDKAQSKLLKDRAGDRGRGVVGLIVDNIRDQFRLLPKGTELGDTFFDDIKRTF